ncbi:endodeoxyribonuclease [Linnemannia schmuckeri]|uniref:Endodeoxyribonuclease n=1 Tax=Linnemannia schmuckeri TaxID=64567 RepID=A0A9P5V5R4_9FUNG|nr:endodeoxyribonuclease [Linnemannia schmuckeri]
MTFGCQPAVDGIVEDLACTLEVPRSSLNVVAGTRSVVFGSVRILVKALGGRQRETSGVKGGGECEECEEVGQLPWLHEEIADSPFSKAQTSSNNKQSHQRQEEEGCDPLDSRFSQTNYNTLVPIPVRFSDIVEIEIHPRTRFVLVIEKEATFSNLISLGFYETHGPCILLTSKGYPDQVVRQLLKALSEMVLSGVYLRKFPYTSPGDGGDCRDSDCDVGRSSVNVPSVCQSSMRARRPPPLEIPLLALMDCDPQGIEIYLTYRCGSIKSAYENANLAVPALKCLGQFPSDWDLVLNPRPACTTSNEAHLGQEQENENDEEQERSRCRLKEAFISLTVKDRKKLERLLTTHPYICQHTQWKNQIARMLEVDAKTEIQSLHQLTSTGSGAFVVVGGSEGESEGGGNIARGAEGEGELPSSSALVLYLQRKLQDPESWL